MSKKTLRELRLALRKTQAEIAHLSGIHRRTYYKIENGRSKHATTLQIAEKIAKALSVDSVHDIVWPNGISLRDSIDSPLSRNIRLRHKDKQVIKYSLLWWRIKLNLSQEMLAGKAGLNHFTVHKIENGTCGSEIHTDTAYKILKALGLKDLTEVKWPVPVSNDCYGGSSGRGGRTLDSPSVITKVRPRVRCSSCNYEKASNGTCGCDW